MGRIAWIRFLAGVLAAAGLFVTPASAACVDAIEWRGLLYVGARNEFPVADEGTQLGEGMVPACRDSEVVGTGCTADVTEESGGESVDVFRLPGVHPEVAVVALVPGPVAYIGPGYMTELPDHPLHDRIYGSARRPNERAGWNCSEPIALTGTVVSAPAFGGGALEVRVDANPLRGQDGRTGLFTDALTRISGFDRNGIPYVSKGDKLRASVRECTTGEGQYKVVPDSISAFD
jgi:hypothetical protein